MINILFSSKARTDPNVTCQTTSSTPPPAILPHPPGETEHVRAYHYLHAWLQYS